MHKNSRLYRLLALFVCLTMLMSNSAALAQQKRRTNSTPQAGSQNSGPKVRLVVGIVIDQFRYDYLIRFGELFGEGGFKRLIGNGALFTNANYIQVPTYTAVGHSIFMSGAPPAMSGIIGNEWFDRETGKRVTSVSDDSMKLLGGREGASGMSPINLTGSTVGDELKLASVGRSKVIGISLKDRSAILPAGKRPNAAYWYDNTTGNLVSSTYYFNDLPEWVKKFNREQRPDRFFGKRWEKLLPEEAYQSSTADDMNYEKGPNGNKFPYIITGGEESPGPRFYNQFEYTPFANDYLVDFAKAAIENEKLGADDITDLLTISFSANDLIGHAYGPYSQEIEDVTLRTDRTIAEFLNYLDQKIGLDRTIIVLTGDHGVAPVAEQVRGLGYGGRLEAKTLTDTIKGSLDKRFNNENWILSFVNGNVYLDEAVIDRRKLSPDEVERAACQAAMKMPGIAGCFTRSQIIAGELPDTKIARAVTNGFYAPRNGNLVIVPQPFFFFGEGLGTTHGTPYSYDTHVPIIISASGIVPGAYLNVCSPADIAPTLAALLRIEAPSNSVGRILIEAMKNNH